MSQPNKFDLLNRVTISTLDAKAKILLVELILRWNQETSQLNPGVERLCKARGIKLAKSFKGADFYLPGLVNVHRSSGKRNAYSLDLLAIMALPEAEVNTDKYTTQNPPSIEGYPATNNSTNSNPPSVEGYYPPSVEGYYPPSVEGYYPPSVEGSDSSVNNSSYISSYREDVPQTLELPEELDGTSCLADKIPSSVSGDLKDAPSALGILESLDFFGKEDSVTDSNFSGESNNGTSCLDSYTETDSEREEKMSLLGNSNTNEISIGKTLIESSTHTSNSSIRTWKEEADLARQKQNQKILETIAQQKALKEAQEARQEAFRASLAELHPELTEASQNAVQSLQDIPSVSRLDKYAGLRAS